MFMKNQLNFLVSPIIKLYIKYFPQKTKLHLYEWIHHSSEIYLHNVQIILILKAKYLHHKV